jgi:hypothetical protein
MFDLLLSTLEVKVFHWKEFFKTNINIVINFFVIIAIPFIKHHMDRVHNSICDFITQLHNHLDVHSIWKKNILMKTSPIPIKCLHGILRVAITSHATLSKNNLSIIAGNGISATSTTQSSSPQHPMQKNGNQRHVPSLHNPHSPLRLDLLKDKSLPWLSFFLLQAPSPKLIHNAFQSVGLSVFAAGA